MQLTIASIPVRIQPWFFAIALILGISLHSLDVGLLIAWVAIVLVSVLLHELGHAVTARSYGATVEIELHGLGGLTRWHRPEPVSPGGRLLISAAGSAVGIAIGASVWALTIMTDVEATAGPFLTTVLRNIIWVNLGWGLINWVPIRQLDGGHILESLLEILFPRRFEAIADVVFVVVAAAAVGVALWLRLPLLALFAAIFGFSGLGRFRARGDARRDEQLLQRLREAEGALKAGDYQVALDEGRALAPQFRAASHRQAASSLVARSLLGLGNIDEAVRLIDGRPDHLAFSRLDEGLVYLAAGRLSPAVDRLSESILDDGDRRALPLLLRAHAQAGTFTEAVTFLQELPPNLLEAEDMRELAKAARQEGALNDAVELEALAERLSDPDTASPS